METHFLATAGVARSSGSSGHRAESGGFSLLVNNFREMASGGPNAREMHLWIGKCGRPGRWRKVANDRPLLSGEVGGQPNQGLRGEKMMDSAQDILSYFPVYVMFR